jgi:hypothetical protein
VEKRRRGRTDVSLAVEAEWEAPFQHSATCERSTEWSTERVRKGPLLREMSKPEARREKAACE